MAGHAMTILVNLANDNDVLELIATDDQFMDLVLSKVVVRVYTVPHSSLGHPSITTRPLQGFTSP
jgi:hypothetical protein